MSFTKHVKQTCQEDQHVNKTFRETTLHGNRIKKLCTVIKIALLTKHAAV